MLEMGKKIAKAWGLKGVQEWLVSLDSNYT